MGNINIRDVARHCNISVSTVSRVLNDRPDVNPETRQRVLAAIRNLDFIPNNSARNLVMTSNDCIGIVVRGISNPFFAQMYRIIEHDIYDAGYTLALHHIGSNADEVHTAAVMATEKRLSGVLFLGGRFNYTPEDMRLLGIPYVCATYQNTFGTLSKDEYASVAIDDRAEARRAVEYLIGMGHRKIAAVVAWKDDRSISELRLAGYREALEAHGIPYDPALVAESGSFTQPDAAKATERLLASGADFTAVFTIADMMALAVIKVLTDFGRRVPDDCSVIGIDGLDYSLYSIPTLTTVVQPAAKLAHESARLIINLVRGGEEDRHCIFPAMIREGGSVKRLD